MVPTTRLIRFAMVPLLGAVLVLSGCFRSGPDSVEAALYDYVAAVNARDRAALEKLAPRNDPSSWADWVLANAPAGPMEIRHFRIEGGEFPGVSYAYVKWGENGGVPKDGAFGLQRRDGGVGPWAMGFLYEGPGKTPSPSPKPSRSPTRK
ncbi:MAG: hypothetical protein U0990_06890 [Candidatus Nanopelagicales bacterium]|nr:hypothetical protein [Candidatus Nanopelagicales bacterium]MDZ4249802.1 hypothetical protein [Candidatus Nanopelagicales bacterium]